MALRDDAKQQGEQLTPYSFRHRYAKGMHAANIPIANISEAMGHTIEGTSYARFKPNATADLVAAVNGSMTSVIATSRDCRWADSRTVEEVEPPDWVTPSVACILCRRSASLTAFSITFREVYGSMDRRQLRGRKNVCQRQKPTFCDPNPYLPLCFSRCTGRRQADLDLFLLFADTVKDAVCVSTTLSRYHSDSAPGRNFAATNNRRKKTAAG